MLSRINNYLKTKVTDSKKFFKKAIPSQGIFCCLSILPTEISFLLANKKTKKIVISESIAHTTKNIANIINKWVKEHNLKNIPCALLLPPEDYQLLITDALPVPPSEFQAAIRFKVKDLLHFPNDDVLIESFPIPKTKAETPEKIMLVATRSSKLQTHNKIIRESGLNLQTIDIQELALRNITHLFEKEENSVALIYIQEKNIQLIITRQNEIYITRNLVLNLKFPDNPNEPMPEKHDIERLASELQRSFGYYQSQWRHAAPSCLLLASVKNYPLEILPILSDLLKTPVQALKLDKEIITTLPISEIQQARYLPLIGEVLREEG